MMLMAFKTYLKVALRNRSIVFWVMAFPLIMMFMFQLMFSDIGDLMHVDPQPMAVVEGTNWNRRAGAAQVVKALSREAMMMPVKTIPGRRTTDWPSPNPFPMWMRPNAWWPMARPKDICMLMIMGRCGWRLPIPLRL